MSYPSLNGYKVENRVIDTTSSFVLAFWSNKLKNEASKDAGRV